MALPHVHPAARPRESWPELPFEAWRDTKETLHRWMQVVGKIKLGLTPTVNHWWNAAFEVNARGVTTGFVPYGDRWFDLELDLVDHYLHLRTNDGGARSMQLRPRSVAEFYADLIELLRGQGIEVPIWPVPVEIDDPIRLDLDDRHRAYDPRYVERFWRTLGRTAALLARFRARFIGKASPPLFWWGTFDLSASRFSGRRVPGAERLGTIERNAYSHEVCSAGWWPGDLRLAEPSFFSYIAPEPEGYADATLSVPGAYYHSELHGFYLSQDSLRRADDPDATLLAFFQESYDHAATLARWPRGELERADGF